MELVHELVTIDLPVAKSAEGGDFSVVNFGHGSNRDGLLMNSHSDVERARL